MAQVFRPNAPVTSWEDPFDRFKAEAEIEFGAPVDEDQALTHFLFGSTVAEYVAYLKDL